VLKRGKVIVGTGGTNPPWHFEDQQGNIVGFDIEMAHLLAKVLFADPTKVEFVRPASDARIPNLQTNQVDITFQFMMVTAQRAQQVDFSLPYYGEGVGTLLLKDSPYSGAADLAEARAGNLIREIVLVLGCVHDRDQQKDFAIWQPQQHPLCVSKIQQILDGLGNRCQLNRSHNSTLRFLGCAGVGEDLGL
jgi:ABC-type amino acid transport substrate-binding protein